MKLLKNILLLLTCSIFSLHASTSFGDFIKGKTLQEGYFSFYLDDEAGKVYLAIDKFDQAFLFQSSMPHGIGSNDIGLDRGQLGDTRLVQFERVGNKVFLRQKNTYYRANSQNVLEKKAVNEAFASSIIWGFKVETTSKDKAVVLIDYTPFLLSDIHNISDTLKRRKEGNFKIDASRSGLYKKRIKAFPKNTELEATVTYKGSGAGKYLRTVTPENSAITVNLHHSLIKLPDDNYQTRAFHPFSGFWSHSYADYASAIDQPLIKRVIPRHRLTKKNPAAKVSEAVEPIIYYLDAGVPEPVKSALLDGARWWNQAYEAIGYKDAFQVKMLPADADPMDVRYNVIQWVHRATRGWSYGSSVIDPRTGEIMKGHVTLGSLRVRQDYLIALGLTSPFDTAETDTSAMKEMALARIRQLSAHEVGHTLGIAHNFAASTNDRASVMDYPHPFITLNNGEIDLSKAYDDKIGVWDKHVIAYGYSDLTEENESNFLASTIKSAQEKGLLYVSDADARPHSGAHNTGHLWDNGKNASQELLRMLAVREKALADFGVNSIPVGTPLSEIEPVLVPIYNFHRFQVEATAKLIAGVDYSYQVREENQNVELATVDGKTQTAALNALLTTLSPDVLTLPEHIIKLIPPKAYGYYRDRESFISNTGLTFDPVSAAEASAKHTLTLLLNAGRLARLQQQSMLNTDVFSIAELFDKLIKSTIKSKPEKALKVLTQQRVNQQVVEHLLALWHQKGLVSEVRSEVFYSLTQLKRWLKENQKSRKYKAMAAQFSLLENQIEYSLGQGKLMTPKSTIKMPPGSPIGSVY
ncbi:zinc-dependent metalloprotease [Thalassotalea castellviae]|uniref:Zinc-dependent metalloprotease n=1 Tax=Thalassotalea castellviae TaxID=3075612 RepID=A0ABU3A499_9GAMM|nr:zinc-dependent metalloprotease [Thalassotalea sp. W431]MDT0605003.1 zinc-dependent metalloprotease [Thalassotalea sp. W431]